MSVTQAAWQAEKALGHDNNAVTAQDVSNYSETGDPNATMKALTWQGPGKVVMCEQRPAIPSHRVLARLKLTVGSGCSPT
jgi:hypothetical protein